LLGLLQAGHGSPLRRMVIFGASGDRHEKTGNRYRRRRIDWNGVVMGATLKSVLTLPKLAPAFTEMGVSLDLHPRHTKYEGVVVVQRTEVHVETLYFPSPTGN
jgi:hypothetical protein